MLIDDVSYISDVQKAVSNVINYLQVENYKVDTFRGTQVLYKVDKKI